MRIFLFGCILGVSYLSNSALAADAPKPRDATALELEGTASDFWFTHNWRAYYWREDFTFLLTEANGKIWRIISREPTPAFIFRMGTTFTDLKVDWKAKPHVKVVGVNIIDRAPPDFYDFKLDEENVATALLVYVETEPKTYKEYFVDNWFHRWGEKADKLVYSHYADKPAMYEIYGYVQTPAAPFDAKSRDILDKLKDKKPLNYHGRVHATKDNDFGYEIEIIDVIGKNPQGGHFVLYGDAKTIPLLDGRRPEAIAKHLFTDVTKDSGLKIADKTDVGGTNSHSVAVEDFNGDGLPDIIMLTFNDPHVYYFRNKGNLKFENVTKGSGLETIDGDGSGIAVADFDHDGILDVYVTSLRRGSSRLFKGKGDGTFEDVSEKAGVLLKTPGRSCAWSDVDGDGWPDLFVTAPGQGNTLYRNNKDGTFTNITAESGLEMKGRECLGCAFGDIDGDGLDDLFITCYQSQVSAMFKNLGGGKFKDITEEAGLARKSSAVGCAFGDILNRGRLDLYVSTDSWLSGENATEEQLTKKGHTVEPDLLYLNDGQGKFTPVDEPSLALKTLAHDISIEDFDHKGWPDIYVALDAQSGNRFATSKGGNRMWTRPDGKKWKEVGENWGVRYESNCVCAPAADFDNDGDMDLLLVSFYGQPVLYRNETNDKNWLRVKAVGTKSSLEGIGAKISLYRTDGGKKELVGFQQIQSGSGYCKCSPLEAHFGLGKTPGEYRVEVLFPVTKKVIALDNVKPSQRVVVKEE